MNGVNINFLGESPLQKFLRSGYNEPLKCLEVELGIKCKRHPRYPNLILFVYDQIDSPKVHPIVRSARGHILDEDNNWEHVCRPFDRFLNWGEAVDAGALTPDLTDPATAGCLLALVREAWGMPTGLIVRYNDDTRHWLVSWAGATHGGECGSGDTEAEALVTALENAA